MAIDESSRLDAGVQQNMRDFCATLSAGRKGTPMIRRSKLDNL